MIREKVYCGFQMLGVDRLQPLLLRFSAALLCCFMIACQPVVPKPLASLPAGTNADPRSNANSDSNSNKRALIVAISQYDSSTGWNSLNSQNDTPLIRAALMQQGFSKSSIRELRDSDATKKGIIEAVRKHLLEPARPGDVLVFHYSGHGQQISDIEPYDELDGYDEALVPYDAPMRPDASTYDGARHLRDDELNGLVREMRDKVGRTGNVVVFLDSCYSGTGVRGLAQVRGGAPPIGNPRSGTRGRSQSDAGGGFFDPSAAARGTAGQKPGGAPYVVFSAAKHGELAYETRSDDGAPVGSLSYALSKAMAGANRRSTYRTLYDEVRWQMQQLQVSNTPQREGDIDALIFSGRAVQQLPYIEVAQAASGGSRVTLKAGSLMGLSKDSLVEIHKSGTVKPGPATLLAKGRIVAATPLTATVALDNSAGSTELQRGRAFVTHYAFGHLGIKVQLQGFGTGGLGAELDQKLKKTGVVQVVQAGPDVLVSLQPARGNVIVRVAGTGQPIFGPRPKNSPNLAEQIADRLVYYARNQYLRGLKLPGKDFDVALEIVPVKVENCSGGQISMSSCTVTKVSRSSVDHSTWRIGDAFQLRITNTSSRNAYIAILDLASDGTIGLLWPPPKTQDKTILSGGDSKVLDAIYKFTEPPGSEVFLLIATDQWVDFEPFTTPPSRGTRGEPKGPLGPFAPLFDKDTGTRGTAANFSTGGDGFVYAKPMTLTVVR